MILLQAAYAHGSGACGSSKRPHVKRPADAKQATSYASHAPELVAPIKQTSVAGELQVHCVYIAAVCCSHEHDPKLALRLPLFSVDTLRHIAQWIPCKPEPQAVVYELELTFVKVIHTYCT